MVRLVVPDCFELSEFCEGFREVIKEFFETDSFLALQLRSDERDRLEAQGLVDHGGQNKHMEMVGAALSIKSFAKVG